MDILEKIVNGQDIKTGIKAKILTKASETCSDKDIAKEANVSEATVQRTINQGSKQYRPHYHTLPSYLSFDEFKYASGRMAFEYIDGQNGLILDFLTSKHSRSVSNHFISHYSLKQREKVKTITVDMNASYASFIPWLFAKAEIIIDRFHIVQLVNRSMSKTRVKIMNQFHTSNGEDQKKYRRLKHFWKKILKKETALSYAKYQRYKLFGQRLESAIVSEMLSYDSELKATYDVYQRLFKQ